MNHDDLITLGIAVGLGLLVGLQRERTNSVLAGVRTFTLISVLGAISGFVTRDFSNPFILPVLVLCLAGFFISGNFLKKYSDNQDFGQTTEVAALLMYVIGAYLVLGDQIIGVVVGALLAIILYLKKRLHGFIDNLTGKDLSAIMTFTGISLVILPILPNETYGPLDVLNPQNIWLMVTLIVGISVVGYFIYKFLGKDIGLLANTILGGLISSTATTVSYSRKAMKAKPLSLTAAFVITGASAISFVRIILEISVVAPKIIPKIILPFLAIFLVMVILSAIVYYRINKNKDEEAFPDPRNPAQLKVALIFGLFYGLILFAVAYIKEEFGSDALYIVSAASGLTDVDAITLSVSQLIQRDDVTVDTGWRVILLASLSNLFFKGILTVIMGTKLLGKWVSILFGITIVSGVLIIWLWPLIQ